MTLSNTKKFLPVSKTVFGLTMAIGLFGFVNSSPVASAAQIQPLVFEVNGVPVAAPITMNVGDTLTVDADIWFYRIDTWAISASSAITFDSGSNLISNHVVFTGVAASATSAENFVITIDGDPLHLGNATETTNFQLTVVDPNASSAPSTDSANAARLAAEAARQAAVVVAKSTLLSSIKSNIKPTLSDYRAADFGINKQETVERINKTLLALAKTDTANALTQIDIETVVFKESFVEFVSTETTNQRVTTLQLVKHGLISANYKYKASILRAIKTTALEQLDTFEEITAAVAAEVARIKARSDRLTAIIKKINHS